MGLFAWRKKKDVINNEKYSDSEISIKDDNDYSMTLPNTNKKSTAGLNSSDALERDIMHLEDKLASSYDSPGMRHMNEVASKQASDVLKEMANKDFEKKLGKAYNSLYMLVVPSKYSFLNNQDKTKKIEQMVGMARQSISDFSETDLLLPYLLDKELMGILNKKEEISILQNARERYNNKYEFAKLVFLSEVINVNMGLFEGLIVEKIPTLFENYKNIGPILQEGKKENLTDDSNGVKKSR